jgi:hypothetical protein
MKYTNQQNAPRLAKYLMVFSLLALLGIPPNTDTATGMAHLIVLLECVQFAPLSTGSARITYFSGTVPVPLLQAPLHCPAVTHVALHATGLQGFLLLHAVVERVSPTSASQAVPFRSAGVVMTYLRRSSINRRFCLTVCAVQELCSANMSRTLASQAVPFRSAGVVITYPQRSKFDSHICAMQQLCCRYPTPT